MSDPPLPRRIARAVAFPSNIYRYVWEPSGWHQLPLVVLTIGVSLLEVVPLASVVSGVGRERFR